MLAQLERAWFETMVNIITQRSCLRSWWPWHSLISRGWHDGCQPQIVQPASRAEAGLVGRQEQPGMDALRRGWALFGHHIDRQAFF
eukprot:scaffold151090_cov23-Tisochrysis_lutea.AAC.1